MTTLNPNDRTQTFSLDTMETALCLWEALLADRQREYYNAAWDANGTWDMRHKCIAIAPHCDAVWQALTNNGQDDTITFDWEYVPAYAAHCVDWITGEGHPVADCVAVLRSAFYEAGE